MRSAILLGLSALAAAQLDFAVIDAAPAPKAPVVVPMGVGAVKSIISTYSSYQPKPTATKKPRGYPIQKRATASSSSTASPSCTSLPAGSGPVPSPDTASAFLNSPTLSSIAAAAPSAKGYTNVFSNLQASSSTNSYLGFTTLNSYDTAACGKMCDSTNGCISFNIFFERDPACVPTTDYPNPPSTNVIKCVLWGSPVTAGNTNNAGQYQQQFQVVIAGSNGYVASSTAPVPGYNPAHNLGNAAINAVNDCNSVNTYITSAFFTDGQPFDPARCAQACAATSAYNQGQGSNVTCQFFNTYILYKNGVAQGQFCAEFTQFLPDSYATNTGQVRGSDNYTIGYSYSYTNATNSGVPSNCKLPGQ